MKDRSIAILLRSLKDAEPLDALTKHGFNFVQIGQILAHAERNKLVEWRDDRPCLTADGIEFLHNKARLELMERGWIEPYFALLDSNLKPFDVYLPNKRVLRKFARWKEH